MHLNSGKPCSALGKPPGNANSPQCFEKTQVCEYSSLCLDGQEVGRMATISNSNEGGNNTENSLGACVWETLSSPLGAHCGVPRPSPALAIPDTQEVLSQCPPTRHHPSQMISCALSYSSSRRLVTADHCTMVYPSRQCLPHSLHDHPLLHLAKCLVP